MNISDITNKLGKSISDVVDFVSDKNKTNAQLSRLKTVMRHEIDALNDCYMELGMYYYENLRDNSDINTSDLCEQIDSLKANIKAAAEKYNAIKGRDCGVCDGECEIVIETTDDNLKDEPVCEEKSEELKEEAEEDNDVADVSETPRKTIKMILKNDETSQKAVEEDDDEVCDDEAEDEED